MGRQHPHPASPIEGRSNHHESPRPDMGRLGGGDRNAQKNPHVAPSWRARGRIVSRCRALGQGGACLKRMRPSLDE